ncbi:MAG TPA: dienelactone hydrolase family protein [Planctomycetota bacterium]|nr:dienelactone hydrolase family protein [Planctomycetota bacterium]
MSPRLLFLAACVSCLHLSAAEPPPSARLITEDSKTKGDWQVAYGADGGEVVGDKPFYPKYAQVVKSGQFFIWSPDTEEDCALNKKESEERVAACFYDKRMTMELFLTGGEHRVALYFNDFNKRGRSQKVEVLDGRNNSVLVSRTVSDFADGKYVVYDMSGHLKIRLTAENGDSAVFNGIFFGKAAKNTPRKTRVAGEMPTTPGFHKHRFYATVNGKKILVPYIAYLPEGYDKNQDKYPVVVHLHGAGEGGTDCNAIFNTGVPADMRGNEPLRKGVGSRFIGFWPQSVMGWDPPMTTATIQALDDFLDKARADKERVYCTGYSMGGRGTWVLAEEAAPRFAAIVPMDPFGWQPEVAQKNLKDTSIWIIVGAQDGDHTIGSKMMYQKMKEVDADVYLTVVPNCGHGAWGRFMPDPTTYEWMLKHKRGSKERFELPPNGVIEDPVEKFKKFALKTPPNDGKEGSILCQFWRGIGGSNVSDLTNNEDFPDFPSENYYMKEMAIVPNLDDNYGTRLCGFVVPPATGEYTFWIASDDGSELWLSSDETENNRKLIAKVDGFTPFQAWDSQPQQKSKKIKLEAGKHYYIEALHKEGGGDDHVSVGWQLPDGKMERPIPGARTIPAQIRKRGPPKAPVVTLLDDVKNFQKPGMHKLKATIQFERQKVDMSYCLFVPNNYRSAGVPPASGNAAGMPVVPGGDANGFPMFVFLHGNSHQGNDWNGLLNEGPPQMLKDDKKLRDAMPMLGFFPQAPADKRWDNRMIIQATVALLMEVEKNWNIDKDRVYCTGLSMGGMGTWFVVEEAPWLFAAAVPISAVAVRIEIAPNRLKDVPVWIICGSEDGGFTDGSLKMHEAFKNNGNDVKLTNWKGEGHGVWGQFYPKMEIYNWMMEHRRKPKAPPVVVAQANPAPVVPAVVKPAPVAPATVTPPTVPGVTPTPAPAQTSSLVIAPKPATTSATVPAVTWVPVTSIPAPSVEAPIALAPRVPYAQVMLALAGAAFLMAMWVLGTRE